MRICRSCGAQIIWAVTASGSKMPVDAEPVENGNLILRKTESESGPILVAIISPDGDYVSHFATCLNAAEHRKGSDG